MKTHLELLRRGSAALAALALVVGATVPTLVAPLASASQLVDRSMQLSDSGASGGSITTGVGSGTNVSYKLTFTTLAAMQSMVVDFCDNTPLIGDATCTAPAGMTNASAALTANGAWSLGTPDNVYQWRLTNTGSQAAGTFTFEVTGMVNPNTQNHSYYARITTYSDATYGSSGTAYSSPGSVGSKVDDGGIALSTATPITVTARVMETLSLCTSAAAMAAANSCGSATPPSVVLGHTANNILTSDQTDTASVFTQLSTNAANGYALYLRASNLACPNGASAGGGLSKDGGSNCHIPAINGGSATPSTFPAATAGFGARVSNGTAATSGTGSNTAVSRWNPAADNYLMDTVTSNDNVVSNYGSKIAFTDTGDAKQANSVNNTLTFAAQASPVTPAGIYTENFSLIGVGTF
ncbi:hypothetical protein KBC77_02795 [Candidatus Saccharibacteria bacterium]|nr:hypothetical protein [Candidatus Saccharibacteria bacterium]